MLFASDPHVDAKLASTYSHIHLFVLFHIFFHIIYTRWIPLHRSSRSEIWLLFLRTPECLQVVLGITWQCKSALCYDEYFRGMRWTYFNGIKPYARFGGHPSCDAAGVIAPSQKWMSARLWLFLSTSFQQEKTKYNKILTQYECSLLMFDHKSILTEHAISHCIEMYKFHAPFRQLLVKIIIIIGQWVRCHKIYPEKESSSIHKSMKYNGISGTCCVARTQNSVVRKSFTKSF